MMIMKCFHRGITVKANRKSIAFRCQKRAHRARYGLRDSRICHRRISIHRRYAYIIVAGQQTIFKTCAHFRTLQARVRIVLK